MINPISFKLFPFIPLSVSSNHFYFPIFPLHIFQLVHWITYFGLLIFLLYVMTVTKFWLYPIHKILIKINTFSNCFNSEIFSSSWWRMYRTVLINILHMQLLVYISCIVIISKFYCHKKGWKSICFVQF